MNKTKKNILSHWYSIIVHSSTVHTIFLLFLFLQQIAQHQFEGETLDSSVISALTGVEEDASMEPTDTVNPEIVASTEVENITKAELIDSSEVLD